MELTPAQKAAATRKERIQSARDKDAAIRNDRERAIQICREIRDNPAAADHDRLDAIRLLCSLT